MFTKLILAAYNQGTQGKLATGLLLQDLASEELRELRGEVAEALEMADYIGQRKDNDESSELRAFERVPENLQGGLRRYLDAHIMPGSFLTAVLCNDLREAMGRGDVVTRTGIFDVVSYLHNYAPSNAWGDAAAVKRWTTPTIPVVRGRLGADLEPDTHGQILCPRCLQMHGVYQTISEPHQVHVVEDGPMKKSHSVQYVWCRHQVVVVGVEGKRLERE